VIRPVTTPAATTPQAADPKRAQIKAAAEQFEAVFMRQMIGSMRTASLGDDILGSSSGDQFRDMSDAKVAESMAKNGGGFGIGKMLLQQFDKAGARK
jgi:flagellar protein FlgJ